MNYLGTLICRERMRRDWSQEGLCRGICAVSYLSKIENGKTEASEEIIRMLLERLGLSVSPELEADAKRVAAEAYEYLFSGCRREFESCMSADLAETFRATPEGLDFMLLESLARSGEPLEESLEGCMNTRQLALQRALQDRNEEAAVLLPNAWCRYWAGYAAYAAGDHVRATGHLQAGYDLAARDGSVRLMLDCRVLLGNCCCSRRDTEGMYAHYNASKRLAAAMGETELIAKMNYNIAATQIEMGLYGKAYEFFSAWNGCDVMSQHKLAICCEKLGREEEAHAALNRAESMTCEEVPDELAKLMCDLVRHRLVNPYYLRSEKYGEKLMDCFERCRKTLPIGYAAFHLPWVIEWLKATRQYKRAFELLCDFPNAHLFA